MSCFLSEKDFQREETMSKLHIYTTIFFTFMNSSAVFQYSMNKEEKYYHWQLVSLGQQEPQNKKKLNELVDWFFTIPHAETSTKAQHCLLSSPVLSTVLASALPSTPLYLPLLEMCFDTGRLEGKVLLQSKPSFEKHLS